MNPSSDPQQINAWYCKHTYQYEIPYCLCAKYLDNVIYLHVVNTNIGIITSRPIHQPMLPTQLYYLQENVRNKKTLYLTSQNRKYQLEQQQFESIYTFNQLFQGLWYGIGRKYNIKFAIPLNQFIQGGQRNYLFVPMKNNQIDFNLIQLFLQNKSEKQTDIYIDQKSELLHCVYHKIVDLEKTTIRDYFNILNQFGKFSEKQLMEYYSIESNLLNSNLIYFFFEMPLVRSIETILQIRAQYNRNPLTKNHSVLLVKQMITIQSIHYFFEDQINNLHPKHSLCTVKPKIVLAKQQMILHSEILSNPFCMSSGDIDQFMMLPTFMLDLEQQMVIAEYSCMLNLKFDYNLFKALTRPGFNAQKNYQLLETLGDSMLKYIATLNVSLQHILKNENDLDHMRSQIVCNQFLSQNFHEGSFALNYFIRSLNHQTKWYTPCLSLHFLRLHQPDQIRISESKLSLACIADIFEALIGCSYLHKNSLYDCYQFLQLTQHPAADGPCDLKYFPNISLLGEFDLKQDFNTNMSFLELVNQPTTKSQNLSELQSKWFKYQFKNEFILLECLNLKGQCQLDFNIPLEIYFQYLQQSRIPSQRGHSNLEFIGDAVLECFIMGNAFVLMNNEFTPTHLYKIKMLLLSNSFFAKLGVAYKLYKLLPADLSKEFIQEVDLKEEFRHYNSNFVRVPKVLSDLFEALIGALLIDAGLEQVIKFLSRIYSGFLPFVCKYIDIIDDHVIDRVHQYSALMQGKMDMEVFQEDKMFTCIYRINNQIVGKCTAQNERAAKERAASYACKKLKI